MPIFMHIRDVRLATLGPGDKDTIWASSWVENLTEEFGGKSIEVNVGMQTVTTV